MESHPRTSTSTTDQPVVSSPHPSDTTALATANDRLKETSRVWFWTGIVVSTLAHAAVFMFWPSFEAEAHDGGGGDAIAVVPSPPVDLPPPPAEIPRLAVPVVGTDLGDVDLTIAKTSFIENPVDRLPPPPSDVETNVTDAPVFTPYTVRPDVLNRPEVARALEREYPTILRDAGIGGVVTVWFFIDENGEVQRTQVRESSGHQGLDDAALTVADVFRFSPALNRDKRVPVWISLDIRFQTN